MPSTPDKYKLLHRPYRTPKRRGGDRATCELRGDVVIPSVSND